VLKAYFSRRNILLVGLKLEFGRGKSGKIKLGSELSPETFTLWDIVAPDDFDKNRFRQDLSKGEEALHELYNRLFAAK
jgi:phosphoribosylaminoimidazole-succinocarboxamide synthase